MFKNGLFLEAEKGGTGSGTSITEPQANTGTPPDADKRFTQADVDRIVTERLQRERQTQKEKDDETRRQAEAEAAKKQGEWQKVAEQREIELKRAQSEAREKDIKLLAVQKGIKDADYAVYLVNKAGEGADVENILGEYLKNNPVTTAATVNQGTTNPTNPAASTQLFSRSQLRDPTYFAANKDAIMQAAREGRIKDD